MTVREPWIARLKRTYLGNATATRDLRVQLRGSKATILFGIYLVMMAVILMVVYDSAMGRSSSLASAQSSLESFYYATLVCLGVVIALVAPAMGAFAVVQERQRRSLDLVFSAPVEPKMYLVGKLISSYRYVWLLLILSLPFCAVSVTLGGATWGQLFITFILFSFFGLVCASIGLLNSTFSQKTLPSLLYTYLCVGGYFFITSIAFTVMAATAGGSIPTVSPIGSLTPVSFPFMYGQSTPIFGFQVPVWIVSIIGQMIVVKIIILAAGCQLASNDSKEIASLRIHSWLYCGFLTWILAQAAESMMSMSYRYTGPLPSQSSILSATHGKVLFGFLLLMALFFVPYLSTMSTNDLRRHRPDGMFNVRQMFSGKVSGHLPFILATFLVIVVSYTLSASLVAKSVTSTGSSLPPVAVGGTPAKASTIVLDAFSAISPSFFVYVFLALGFWLLAYSSGAWASSRVLNLSRGRSFSLFTLILVILIPTAVLSIAAPEQIEFDTGVWMFNPITPVLQEAGSGTMLAVFHSIVLISISLFLIARAIPRVKRLSQELPR